MAFNLLHGSQMEERAKLSIQVVAYPLLMVAGLLLLIGSFIWPSVDDGRSTWTEEKAVAHQEVSARLHGLSFRDRSDPEIKKQFDRAEKEYQALDTQLQSARTRGSRTAFWLKITGSVLAVIGGVGIFLQSDAS